MSVTPYWVASQAIPLGLLLYGVQSAKKTKLLYLSKNFKNMEKITNTQRLGCLRNNTKVLNNLNTAVNALEDIYFNHSSHLIDEDKIREISEYLFDILPKLEKENITISYQILQN